MDKIIKFDEYCKKKCDNSNNVNCVNECVIILKHFFIEISKYKKINNEIIKYKLL